MTASILTAAKVLWDYHCIYDPLETADVIIGLGSYDPRVAERAADLFLAGMATWLVFTGKSGHWTDRLYKASEAEAFAEIAIRRGVPEEAITIEPNATNIGENIRFSRERLAPGAISAILVTKPQTQRRVLATAARQWPEARASITAPLVSFEDQPTADHPVEMLISEMTGDLQRILEYPARGYQIAQAVPLEVMEAYDFLIAQGFDGHPVSE
ncbi:YdcF family protein [Brucella anthropi]|uniref:YdcF family protein n=1 Tax=Brucella anthropi TaxID=529 RepID=A0A6I0DC16_BRUAN|nr:YdcF family protein [Brucella anthropi]KAB2763115.1 YdcF family protein [Brucella anthropi]KAB2785353.1 YdcF family protein [Brucella anthropi]UVV67466.1 YdcF family protein [Brucella anthropi]